VDTGLADTLLWCRLPRNTRRSGWSRRP